MTTSAIVTGASSGLGLELALGIGAGGRAVVGVSRSTPTDARWSELVERGDAQHVPGDVSDPDTVERAFQAARDPLDLLVNCAGTGVFGAAGTRS